MSELAVIAAHGRGLARCGVGPAQHQVLLLGAVLLDGVEKVEVLEALVAQQQTVAAREDGLGRVFVAHIGQDAAIVPAPALVDEEAVAHDAGVTILVGAVDVAAAHPHGAGEEGVFGLAVGGLLHDRAEVLAEHLLQAGQLALLANQRELGDVGLVRARQRHQIGREHMAVVGRAHLVGDLRRAGLQFGQQALVKLGRQKVVDHHIAVGVQALFLVGAQARADEGFGHGGVLVEAVNGAGGAAGRSLHDEVGGARAVAVVLDGVFAQAEDLAQGHGLARGGFVVQFVEADHAALGQVGLKILQAVPGRLVQVEIEVGKGDDGLRVLLQEVGEGLGGVALDQLVLLQVAERALTLLQGQHLAEVGLVAGRGAVVAGGNVFAVFIGH